MLKVNVVRCRECKQHRKEYNGKRDSQDYDEELDNCDSTTNCCVAYALNLNRSTILKKIDGESISSKMARLVSSGHPTKHPMTAKSPANVLMPLTTTLMMKVLVLVIGNKHPMSATTAEQAQANPHAKVQPALCLRMRPIATISDKVKFVQLKIQVKRADQRLVHSPLFSLLLLLDLLGEKKLISLQ